MFSTCMGFTLQYSPTLSLSLRCGAMMIMKLSFYADDRTNLVLNMKYGRKDCTDGPYEDAADAYPNPHNGFDTTTEYFKTEFNLTSNETIALLGTYIT